MKALKCKPLAQYASVISICIVSIRILMSLSGGEWARQFIGKSRFICCVHVATACSWVVNSIINYTQVSPLFIQHLRLMKLSHNLHSVQVAALLRIHIIVVHSPFVLLNTRCTHTCRIVVTCTPSKCTCMSYLCVDLQPKMSKKRSNFGKQRFQKNL